MGRLVSESEVNGNISNNISYEYDDYSNRSQMTVSGEETTSLLTIILQTDIIPAYFRKKVRKQAM